MSFAIQFQIKYKISDGITVANSVNSVANTVPFGLWLSKLKIQHACLVRNYSSYLFLCNVNTIE